MTKTTPIAVSFHDLEEFLAELRIDKDRIDRGILRVTPSAAVTAALSSPSRSSPRPSPKACW